MLDAQTQHSSTLVLSTCRGEINETFNTFYREKSERENHEANQAEVTQFINCSVACLTLIILTPGDEETRTNAVFDHFFKRSRGETK